MSGHKIFASGSSNKNLGLAFMIATWLFACFAGHAYALDTGPRFCIVPVKDGMPTGGDVGEAWRITDVSFRIPGIPSLVFTPMNRGGQWTIDTNRRLVPYVGPFPHTFFDQGRWVLEPWSSRVVAAASFGGVSVLKPGATGFEEFDNGHRGHFLGVYVLPRRRLTVLTSEKSGPQVVGEKELTPWLSAAEMAAHNVHGIYSVQDAPSLNAAIVLDLDHNVHVLTDDDQWFQVGTLDRDDHGIIFDAPGSQGALYAAGKSVFFIHKVDDGSGLHFRADVLRSTPAFGAGSVFPVTKLFGQVLTFANRGWFDFHKRWRRLTPHGFEDITGGDIGLPEPGTFPYGRIDDLSTIGRTLIEGRDGFFLYDGEKITPVIGAGRGAIGKLPWVHDLPSIGRAVVATKNGMFQLTKAGALVPLPTPFSADGLPKIDIADWPDSRVALVSTRAGLFTLDSDLRATSVLGGDNVSFGRLNPMTGVNPATGEMVLTGHRALFLAIDAQRSNDSSCREAQRTADRTPESNICLKPVPGTDANSIGFAVGQMIAAPGDRGVLFDSVRGLFLLTADDKITQLESRGGQYTRSLARLPWSGEVIAAGSMETVVRNDMTVQMVASSQHSDLLGVFPSIRSAVIVAGTSGRPIKLIQLEADQYRRVDTPLSRDDVAFIVDAPWFGGPLVETRNGSFLMNRDGQLTKIDVQNPDSSRPGLFGAFDPFAIERFRTIYLWRNGWFRITPDRQGMPVKGLPRDAVVNTSLDPGSGGVLLATSKGVFAVDQDGNARRLGEGSPISLTNSRSLARAPEDNAILSGGTEGLFRIDLDSYEVQPVPNGSKDIVGTVLQITESQFAHFDIVKATNGTYAFTKSGLQVIPALSAASNASRVFVFEQQHRMLVTKRGDNLPVLYDIGRRDAAGTCGREFN
jgi:hypothetical protein